MNKNLLFIIIILLLTITVGILIIQDFAKPRIIYQSETTVTNFTEAYEQPCIPSCIAPTLIDTVANTPYSGNYTDITEEELKALEAL